jgi:hypothetical protein
MVDKPPPPSLPGVRYEAPPASILAQATQMVMNAAKTLEPDEKLALVTVVTTTGANAALVTRVRDDLLVTLWIGKNWGEPLSAGVAAKWSF